MNKLMDSRLEMHRELRGPGRHFFVAPYPTQAWLLPWWTLPTFTRDDTYFSLSRTSNRRSTSTQFIRFEGLKIYKVNVCTYGLLILDLSGQL